MRYRCLGCGKYIKDKFFFGLLHFCVPVEPEVPPSVRRFNDMIRRYHEQDVQATDEEMDEMIKTGLTVKELREKKRDP